MSKIRLGVNIDHVATIRNARGEKYPDPLRAALFAQKSGAKVDFFFFHKVAVLISSILSFVGS